MSRIKSALSYGLKTMPSIRNLVYRKLKKPLAIKRFNIEVTELCDGNCIYCEIHNKEHCNQLDVETLNGLKPSFLFEGVTEIGITGGEPFLHPNLVSI